MKIILSAFLLTLFSTAALAGTDGLFSQPASPPVGSVFGRSGAVTAQSGDYSSYYIPLAGTTAITGQIGASGGWYINPNGSAYFGGYNLSIDSFGDLETTGTVSANNGYNFLDAPLVDSLGNLYIQTAGDGGSGLMGTDCECLIADPSGDITLNADLTDGGGNTGTSGQVLAVVRSGLNTVPRWESPLSVSIPPVVATNVLTAQTTTQTLLSVTPSTSPSFFSINVQVNITALSLDTVLVTLNWTDSTGTARTWNLTPNGGTSSAIMTSGVKVFGSTLIVSNASNFNVVINVNGSGSATYTAYGAVQQLK